MAVPCAVLHMALVAAAASANTWTMSHAQRASMSWSGADELVHVRMRGGSSDDLGSSLSWDSLVGRALLEVVRLVMSPLQSLVARIGLLDSAAYSRFSGLDRLHQQELKIEMPLAAARLNVTRLIVDGLESVKAFELAPAKRSSDLINATSNFATVRLRVLLDGVLQGFGSPPRKTSVRCSLEVHNCSLGVTLRAAVPRKSIVQIALSRSAIDPRTLSLSAEAATVKFGGGFEAVVELEDSDGAWGPPPLVWRWLSRALSRTLTPLLEERLEEVLVHEVQASLQKLMADRHSYRGAAQSASHEHEQHEVEQREVEQREQCGHTQTGGQPTEGAPRRGHESSEEECDT